MQSRTKAKLTAAVAAFTGSILAYGHCAMAQNDTWVADTAGNGSGSYSTTTNWSTGALPAAAGTAIFNENITSTSTVTLNGSQTIETVTLGNTNATSNAGWIINTGTGGPLNLSNPGYDIFTVNQLPGQTEVATINATLANGNNGDDELAKGGQGTLVLTAANTNLSGTVAVNDGVLELNFNAGAATTNILGDNGDFSTTSADPDSTHLELQGGTVVMNGASTGTSSQSFSAGTGLELGDSSIIVNANGTGSPTLNLGLLQHNWASSLDIQLPSSGTVSLTLGTGTGQTGPNQAFGSATSTGGLLVDTGGMAFATVNNGADWAAVTASNDVVAASSVAGFYTTSTATTLAGNADVVGSVVLPASTNTTVTSLRFNGGASSIDIGSPTNTLTTAGILVTSAATGNMVINDGNLVTSASNEFFIDNASATSTLTINANLTGGGDILKSGAGTLVLTGDDTQSGWNYLNSGTTVLNGGTRGVQATAGDTYVGQAFGNTSTLTIENGGTWNSGRTVIAGNPGNYSGGTGVINQTSGTINANFWFSVGLFGQGTYNLSGGTLNTGPLAGDVSEVEIGVFATGSGVVNLSGTGQINIDNGGTIAFGDAGSNETGTFNQNGGTVTFYSDDGVTVGGSNGVQMGEGGTGGASGVWTYNLNDGTLTTPSVSHSTGTAIFNFNGGTLAAAISTTGFMGGITHANVLAGGAIINTNGNNVTMAQALTSGVTGPAVDGGLTKEGVGTLQLAGASTYTGGTTITNGTLQLPTSGIPKPVASYSFDSFSPGPLAVGTVIPNSAPGGSSALNGKVDLTNSTDDVDGASVVAGGPPIGSLTTHALNLDGTGTDILINSQIVDMSNAGSWTFSTWIQTSADGSAMLSKGTNGASWGTGNTVFYLGTSPISGSGGPYPTAVRFGGGFVQGNTAVDDNNWHMITFVDSGGTETVYVNGVADTSLTYPNMGGGDVSNTTMIGYDEDTLTTLDGNANYYGNMDELNFYNTALNVTQIGELMSGNSVTTAGGSTQILPATTPVNITASGASLDLNGQNQSIGSLAGVAGSAVTLEAGTLTTGGNNASTAFAGSISGAGGLVKNGTGTQTLSGSNSYSGGTTVNAGELLIAANGALPDGALAITGGTAQLGHNTGLASLTSLSIGSSGIFDITNNHVLITYGASDPIGSIYAYLKSGYNGGAWNGASGIISSTAQTKTNGLVYSIGWADGADGTHNVAGLVSGEIELKYTLVGDTNLDGSVNGTDFSILAANFGLGVTNWDQGNFGYTSSVNGSDFSALAANFGQGDSGADTAVSPADIAALDAFAAANNLPAPSIAAVPEPATTGILLMAATGLIARRRRSKE